MGETGVVRVFAQDQDVFILTVYDTELNLFVGQLTPRQKADPAVRHALGVQRALSMGNYHSLFDAYMAAPNMGAYIMDHFIDRERVKALMVITKASVSSVTAGLTLMDEYAQIQDYTFTLYPQFACFRFPRCGTRLSCRPFSCIFYKSSSPRSRENSRLQTLHASAFAGFRREISKGPYQRCNMKNFPSVSQRISSPSSTPARIPNYKIVCVMSQRINSSDFLLATQDSKRNYIHSCCLSFSYHNDSVLRWFVSEVQRWSVYAV